MYSVYMKQICCLYVGFILQGISLCMYKYWKILQLKKNLVPYVSDGEYSTYKTNTLYKIQKRHEI